MAWVEYQSPIGPLVLVSDGEALVHIGLPGSRPPTPNENAGEDKVIAHAIRELTQYFRGRRKEFTVPINIEGTEFQEAAWQALLQIPYGETWSYGDQAMAIGKPGAARAVGQANRSNRLPIIIPCHRVLSADGGIGGYMGQGDGARTVKSDLLRLEGSWSD